MNKEQFIKDFAELLETEQDLSEDTVLDDIEEWDSLASVTVMVMFKQKMGLQLEAEKLHNCKTVGDIWKLSGNE